MARGSRNTPGMNNGRRPSYKGGRKEKKRKWSGRGGQNQPLFPHQGSILSGTQSLQGETSGGLISKLLGKSSKQPSSKASLFRSPSGGAASGGDLIQVLKDPSSLTAMLANTQKVLSAAEQIGTMVQQYGPLLKNLPEMWKFYKSMTGSAISIESEDETEDEVEIKSPKPKSTRKKVKATEGTRKRLQIKDKQSVQKKKRKKDSSKPKLYI